ncbi:hypothetical protein ACG7TL_004736 [Trametes sanguinea]
MAEKWPLTDVADFDPDTLDLDHVTPMPKLPRERIAEFGENDWPTFEAMLYFWMGWEAWLASRGVYLLLKPCLDFDPRWKDWDDSQITRPASSYPPYANCVPFEDNGVRHVRTYVSYRILAPAQDAQSRAIFLKLVNTDSDEYVAYERLLQSKAVAFVPLLAPLFDRMTTQVVEDRLTAAEAAVFIDEIAAQLPDSVLDMPVTLARSLDCLGNSDMYWSQTGPEFLAAWAPYRTPGASLVKRLLDRLIQMPLGWRLVRFVRRTLRI